MTTTIRKPYEPRTRCQKVINGPVLVQQNAAQQCDINFIVERFQRTGEMPKPKQEPRYEDVTHLQGDLTESYNRAITTLDEAGRLLSEREREEREAAAKQAEIDKKELEEYRASKTQPPKADGALPESQAAP